MKFYERLHHWLQRHVANRAPDVRIYAADTTEPFLDRWVIIPRNPLISLYLHRFNASDPIPHDHPYTFNASWLIDGVYREEYLDGSHIWRAPGELIVRFGKTPHSVKLLALTDGGFQPAWSLFLTGPRYRVWGFYCPKGWVPWNKAVKTDDPKKFAKNPTPPVCP